MWSFYTLLCVQKKKIKNKKKNPSLLSLLTLPYYMFYKKNSFFFFLSQPSKFLPIYTFYIDLYSKIRFCFIPSVT